MQTAIALVEEQEGIVAGISVFSMERNEKTKILAEIYNVHAVRIVEEEKR